MKTEREREKKRERERKWWAERDGMITILICNQKLEMKLKLTMK